MYTVVRFGTLWQVLKEGHVFTTTHSQLTAEHIACSLNQSKTPTPLEYSTNQVLDLDGRRMDSLTWKK